MSDVFAGSEGCEAEHPRRPIVCPPAALRPTRSLRDDRNPARDWLRPAAWIDVTRFLFCRTYRPRGVR